MFLSNHIIALTANRKLQNKTQSNTMMLRVDLLFLNLLISLEIPEKNRELLLCRATS